MMKKFVAGMVFAVVLNVALMTYKEIKEEVEN